MSYQVLARKWRPRLFQDMVGQSHVLKALTNALDQDRLHHAYLFTGTRGVGKTTLARILAKCLNCEISVSSTPCGKCHVCTAIDEGRFVDLIEVDAASRAKVEETRDLMDNVQYAPTSGRYKVYLIDEIHMFSNHSFNALLKTLEEPPPHVKFLLATTEPKKLPVTILSRCLQFNLNHLTHNQIAKQLAMILNAENVNFDDASIELITHGAAGSMRDALSLLDQAIAYGNGQLEESQIRAMMGVIDAANVSGLLEALSNADADTLLTIIDNIALQNPNFNILLTELLSLLQKIAIIQILPENSTHPLKAKKELVNLAQIMKKEDVQLYYQIAMMGKKDIYLAPDAKSGFEMIMIRMLAFHPAGSAKKKITTQTTPLSVSGPIGEKNKQKKSQIKQKTVAEAKKSAPKEINFNWKKIIDEMALVGLVKELAGHCALKSYTKNKIELSLAKSREHLLNTTQKERLEKAIKTRFGDEIKLSIIIEDTKNETPANINARLKREKQQAIEDAINNDPTVQSLIETFNATLDPDSIQAN